MKTMMVYDELTGEEKPYVMFVGRQEEFLKAYPPKEGWSVVTRIFDPNGINAHRMQMREKLAVAGKDAKEYDPNVGMYAGFQAELINREGRVVATGHAVCAITDPSGRFWEKLETRARNRLITGLGFGSDAFLNDEIEDINDLNRKNRRTENKPSLAVVQTSEKPVETAPAVVKDSGNQVKPMVDVQPAVVRQIRHLCKVKGKPFSEPKTQEEAQKMLETLS